MKILIFSFLLFINFVCFCQNRDSKKQQIIKIDTLEVLKEMSFCSCINNGFPDDSLQAKDPSIFILLESISGSFEIISVLNDYTKKALDSIATIRGIKYRENFNSKRVLVSCIRMYRSKELASYLKSLYSNRKLFPK